MVAGMKWLMLAAALAGCGTDDSPTTLPGDAHYKVSWHPWSTVDQCLAHEGDPAACAVALKVSLCASGRAVWTKRGVAEEGTYAMDDADQGQDWVATIVTRRSLTWFDLENQTLVTDDLRWDVDGAPGIDCAVRF